MFGRIFPEPKAIA